DTRTGGIAGEIAAILFEKAFDDLDGPLVRVTSLDTPVPYAPTLEEHFLPNAKKAFSAAKELARYEGFREKRRAIMAVDIVMPAMGESIFEGTITKWLKKPGDNGERDEPLFEISTDKVDAEIPSPSAGVLKEIKVGEGQTVPIQTVVGVIDAAGSAAGSSAAAPAK